MHQNPSASVNSNPRIPLRSDLRIAFVLIIAAFCVHIVHHSDCE